MKKLLALVLTLALALCAAVAAAEAPATDRAGNAITLPESPSKVVCLSSAATQTLEDLGVLDTLIGVDTYSALYVPELAELPQFDLSSPDMEQIAALQPDLLIVSSLTLYDQSTPYQALQDMGVCVAVVPTATSIDGIKQDVQFLADCFDAHDEGAALVDDMQASIDDLTAIAATITDKKSVYMEIGALPYLYTTGANTYMNEMLTLIGANNVFADQDGWLSPTEESVVAANPDVILTNVDYVEAPVSEILAREGWQSVAAVTNDEVYQIDNVASSLANEHIVESMEEMALAIYPDAYASLVDEAEIAQ